jgi:hypothetical protein
VRQWVLNGPDQEWFTRAQVIAVLGVSERTLRRLIADGLFPRPIRAAPRGDEMWSGLDIACYLYLRGRCHAGPMEPEPVETEGQP